MAPSFILSFMLCLLVVGCRMLHTDGAPFSQRNGLVRQEISGGYNLKIKDAKNVNNIMKQNGSLDVKEATNKSSERKPSTFPRVNTQARSLKNTITLHERRHTTQRQRAKRGVPRRCLPGWWSLCIRLQERRKLKGRTEEESSRGSGGSTKTPTIYDGR